MFVHESYMVGRSGIARLRYTTAVVLIFSLIFGVFGLSAQDSGGSLAVGTEAPVNLDPATGTNDPEALFNRMVFDYLIDITPEGEIVFALATGLDISDDGLTYTFTLRDGVTFHDGSAFDAEDVVFTFERLQTVESSALNLLGAFEVSGEGSTVTFTLPVINADFLFGIGSRFAAILSSGDTQFDTGQPNGTGAFRIAEYIPGERAVFVRNENYWLEGAPLLDRVEHVYIADSAAQVDALLSGDVDFIFKLSLDQVEQLAGSDSVRVIEQATNQHPVIRLHADEGSIGADVRIRQAFKLATDRDQINDFLWDGRATIANNDPIGPVYGAFYDDSIEQPTYDPEAACALILEATGEERLSGLTLRGPDAFSGQYADMAALLQQQWAGACIDVEIEISPEGVYYNDGTWLDTPLGITGWGDRPVPQSYLVEAYAPGASFNESRWEDEELGMLIEQASQTSDVAARAAIYGQISQIFAERGPIIIPFFAPILGATTARVEGLVMNPFPGLTDFRTVSVTGE
jgi:peptide/nickel transport system substrate-binding protein